MTASATETSGDTEAERPAPGPAPGRINRLAGATGPVGVPGPDPASGLPSLRDFLGAEESRLRDLLAFGMAVQAGKPPGPDGVESLRRKAEADLHAYAFRLLHNQVEEIRRQAVAEQLDRFPRPLGFPGAVLANLAALALGAALVAVTLALDPTIPSRLAELLARLSGGA
ncbi:hypothetical protein DFH01_16180 [Falsiroseomonas bella]|uniref:Uncharacterized protein n=1 Tax=Falsiroseomonas bella TaxID=2184016 RepID=A0A317FDR7_9PROT|nr:hypothetical protein [Falsiroseomonas bella]PWS36673.1 hypothetical protein DFH01_16180 [Falsiroseomonas bella]